MKNFNQESDEKNVKKEKKTKKNFFSKFILLMGFSLLIAFGGKLYEIIFSKINENEFKGE